MAALVDGRLLCKLDNDKTVRIWKFRGEKKSAVWIVSCFNLLEK